MDPKEVDEKVGKSSGCFSFFGAMSTMRGAGKDASIAEPGVTLKGGPISADNTGKARYKLEDLYTTDARLQTGSYGTVYKCYHKKTTNSTTTTTTAYAVKIMDRTKLKKVDDDGVFREVAILSELVQHEHVIRLIDFFVEPERLCVVQVLAVGGDVFDRLAQRQVYTENDARHLARILLEAVDGLHSVQPAPIIHRDLKPENLLLKDENDDSSILLADFGFARHVTDEGCKTRCGTPAYVAPEIVLGLPYKTSVDLWSIGCLIYMIIGGYPPFQGKDHRELFRKVRAGDFVFHDTHFGKVSVEAKTVISNLLTVTADKRCTAKEALASDWFKKKSENELSQRDLSATIKEIKSFNARRKWKIATDVIKWASTQPFWKPDAITFSQQLSEWDKELLKSKQDQGPSTDNAAAAAAAAIPLMIKFADTYELGTKLRAGSYATVWQCTHKLTKEVFAVKIIERKGLKPSDDETVLNEVAIMQSLSGNKYVVQLMDFYEEEDRFYLIMEYVLGGDVFDRIVKMTHYTELDARDLAFKLLKAVCSMHKRGIAHRDIKPQNILLRNPDDNAEMLVADFGFARRVHTPSSLTSRVGTPTYVAPEILKNIPHDERVDLWAIGIVIFVLLVGYPPFLEENQVVLFDKIRTGDWTFYERDWGKVSAEAKDLIRGLLVVDPKERWSIQEALRCKWIQQDPATLSNINLSDSIKSLRDKRCRLRTMAKAVIWMKGNNVCEEVPTQAQHIASDQMCEE